MKRLKSFLVFLGVVLLQLFLALMFIVGLLAIGVLIWSHSSDGCGSDIADIALSPDKASLAITYEFDCGATTDFSTNVSIVDSDQDVPHGGGNIFAADTDHGAAETFDRGIGGIQAIWAGPRELLVRYDRRLRVFKQETSYAGVRIVYEALPLYELKQKTKLRPWPEGRRLAPPRRSVHDPEQLHRYSN